MVLQELKNEVKKNLYIFISHLLGKRNLGLTTYGFHNTRAGFKEIIKIREQIPLEMTNAEAMQVYLCAKASLNIKGDIAEVGVFKGGSAAVIAEAVGLKKEIHLFDTFSGLPQTEKVDGEFFEGQYAGGLEEVKNNLKKYKNMFYHKGLFPSTGKGIKNTFSFVHLDVDLYKSTKDSIDYFYPKLSSGGMILVHDYPQLGIIKAIKDGLVGKKMTSLVIAGAQCLIVKQ